MRKLLSLPAIFLSVLFCVVSFAFVAHASSVSSYSPSTAMKGSTVTITVLGSGFSSNMACGIGPDSPFGTVVSSSQLNCTFSPSNYPWANNNPGTYEFWIWQNGTIIYDVMGGFTVNAPVTFNYSLSNSSNISATQGSSGSNTITATLSSGTTQSVSYAASGLPAGATASFSPTSCSPTCSTTLTITTAASTPTGSYTVTVTGAPLSKTTAFTLTVNAGVIAPPAVTTNAASSITSTSAVLNGSANPNGNAATGWFRYSTTNPGSCTDSFGTRAPASGGTALGSGSSLVAYSNSVSGLASGTTYYYCAIASNGGGKALGSVVSFSVPLPSAPTFPTPLTVSPASVVSGGSSTLSWTSSGATSCSASASPANSQWTASGGALSGSQAITNLTVSTIFTITCTNLGGSTPSSATVTVTPPPNVSGYAWAGSGEGATNAAIQQNPGIGWIHMAGSGYGVLVASDGTMSGQAWTDPNDGGDNFGWIDFAPAGPYPASSFVPAQSVRMNRSTGAVTGWARSCTVFASGCSGASRSSAEIGSWDGWIGFGTGGNYTQPVTVSGCNWSGYAWGGGGTSPANDSPIGWIHFGGTSYPVTGSGSGCATQSDLIAGSVSPTAAVAGIATPFSATISNIGSGSTGSGFTNLFQRASDSSGAGAIDIGTYYQSTALASNANATATFSYTFPSAGTYYVRVCADKSSASDTGTISESNEGNNCYTPWTPITVTLPTLSGTFSANPDTIDPGKPSTLTWTSNATSCVGTGFSTSGTANGNTTVNPTQTSAYQITCTKSGYTDLTLATTVTVISVTASISAKPSCVSGGGKSNVSWSATPATQINSCTISSDRTVSGFPITQPSPGPFTSPTGGQPASIPNSKTVFTLSCTTKGNSVITKTATVDITSCWMEF